MKKTLQNNRISFSDGNNLIAIHFKEIILKPLVKDKAISFK